MVDVAVVGEGDVAEMILVVEANVGVASDGVASYGDEEAPVEDDGVASSVVEGEVVDDTPQGTQMGKEPNSQVQKVGDGIAVVVDDIVAVVGNDHAEASS